MCLRVQDARVAAVEHALDFLADYTDVGGGDFLARRFAQEVWPQLALLLHRGPDTALGSDDGGPAPAVVQRTRAAVFACLLRCVHWRASTCLRTSGCLLAPVRSSWPNISDRM
jgi:hypothetical protein